MSRNRHRIIYQPPILYLHNSESSIFLGVLASTSFALCNNRLATIVLMCLCLENKYITSVIVIIEIMEDVNVKILTILLRKEFL